MKCVILVAGHAARLETEIRADDSRKYEHLVGVPKALLPTKTSKTLLDCWWVHLRTPLLFTSGRTLPKKTKTRNSRQQHAHPSTSSAAFGEGAMARHWFCMSRGWIQLNNGKLFLVFFFLFLFLFFNGLVHIIWILIIRLLHSPEPDICTHTTCY